MLELQDSTAERGNMHGNQSEVSLGEPTTIWLEIFVGQNFYGFCRLVSDCKNFTNNQILPTKFEPHGKVSDVS